MKMTSHTNLPVWVSQTFTTMPRSVLAFPFMYVCIPAAVFEQKEPNCSCSLQDYKFSGRSISLLYLWGGTFCSLVVRVVIIVWWWSGILGICIYMGSNSVLYGFVGRVVIIIVWWWSVLIVLWFRKSPLLYMYIIMH